MDKPANKDLASRGVELRALDLSGPHDALVAALKDIPILISTIHPMEQLSQIPLATAAKEAGVSRFFPCAVGPIIPVGGIHHFRDQKEQIFNHVKKLGLSYTIVDVGWWYQLAFPRLPSGRLDHLTFQMDMHLAGDGNVPSALTDVRDIGRYFARIVRDDRTRDKYVLAYNETWTQNQIWDALSRIAGEEVPKTYDSAETLEAQIAAARAAFDEDPAALFKLINRQYLYTWGIRGDNTPEYAKYLGYLTSKELYPDMGHIGFEEFLRELPSGTVKGVYDDRREGLKAAFSSFDFSKGGK